MIWYPWPVPRFLYLLSAVLFALLFAGGPDAVSIRSFGELWNLGHVLAFALWGSLLLRTRLLSERSWRHQAAAVLGVSLLFGILSEGLQVWFARSPDLSDLARDLLGGLLALAFFAPGRKQLTSGARRLLQGGGLAGLGIALIPLLLAVYDDVRGRLRFPVLSDFESSLEAGRWEVWNGRISTAAGVAFQGGAALKVDLTTDDYSGTMLKYFPRDWSAFEVLRFAVLNPDRTPLEIHVRIHDRFHKARHQHYHDRFNTTRVLLPGWNAVDIRMQDVAGAPRGRRMDMKNIERLGVFVENLPRPGTLYIDHVRLE